MKKIDKKIKEVKKEAVIYEGCAVFLDLYKKGFLNGDLDNYIFIYEKFCDEFKKIKGWKSEYYPKVYVKSRMLIANV